MNTFDECLVKLLEKAIEMTFCSLLKKHENFYYFSLLIDEGMIPYASVWSYEALDKVISEINLENWKIENERLEYRFCLRIGHYKNNWDYHFWLQSDNGEWCDKPDWRNAARKQGDVNPSEQDWEHMGIANFYDSDTIYFAVTE